MELRSLRDRQELDSSDPLPIDAPFTTDLARAEGVRPHQLRWLLQHHFLRQPVRGVYVARQVPDSVPLRCDALRLVVPDDCVVVDRHAGWLQGAEMVLAPGEHLNLRPVTMFRPSGHGRLRNGLADSGERNLRTEDITEVHGIAVSTPLRTALDLGRVRWPEQALAALDAMLRLGRFSHDELLDGVERFKGMRWVSTLRAIAPLADGRAASPPESVLRLRWIECAMGAPVPQVEVWAEGELLGILDLADEDLRYAAEYDGVEWHTSPEQVVHDRARRAAVSNEDWLIDVFVQEDLWGPTANATGRLRSGMALSERRFGHARRLA